MEKLFGIPMGGLALGLAAIVIGIAVLTALLALRNRVMFKLGVRNVPRRPAQTFLIILGLMLATLIISAALGTGDTVTHSIRSLVIESLGPTDQMVHGQGKDGVLFGPSTGPRYFSAQQAAELQERLAGDNDIDGITPAILERAPLKSLRSGQHEPSARLLAVSPKTGDAFSLFHVRGGGSIQADQVPDGSAYVNARAARKLDIVAGDTLEMTLRGQPVPVTVQGVVEDLGTLFDTGEGRSAEPVVITSLPFAQRALGRSGEINLILVSNRGGHIAGAELTDKVTPKVEQALEGSGLTVRKSKQEALEFSDQIGTVFTSVFVIFGLFSIAAGILLIFMIFVMLAAERKTEMGMARAVGAQRRHLVQMFLFEGGLYNLIAAAVGATLGVIASYGMVRIMAAALAATSEDLFDFQFSFRLRSLIVAYTLGILITLVTVAFSAWRVSKLNIVRAIRDLPEPRLAAKGRLLLWGLLATGLGILLTFAGRGSVELAPFMLGVSLVIVGVSVLMRRFGVPERGAYTFAGLALLVWWLVPLDLTEPLFGETPGQGMEMFVLSGLMVVLGAVWTVIYNSDVVLTAVMRLFGGIRSLAPVLKTAVSYPMTNRFRTGMTLAMFSLIVFTLVVMMAITEGSKRATADVDRTTGGLHLVGSVSYQNPLADLEGAVRNAPGISPGQVERVVSLSTFAIGVRQQAPEGEAPREFGVYPLRGLDNSFLDFGAFKLRLLAEGYETPAQVWQAVKQNPDLAVLDPLVVPTKNRYNFGFVPSDFRVTGFYMEDESFKPVGLEVRNPLTNEVTTLTVIGVLDPTTTFFTEEYVNIGLFTSKATMDRVTGVPIPLTTFFVRLAPGADAKAAAAALEAAYPANGLEATSVQEELDDNNRASTMFNYLITGFTALGLVVGIAALGVITARSVVERRQQIGMLRAIGFQRGMVQTSFLLEASFVSLLGIAIGVVLGVIMAWNISLYVSEQFEGFVFAVPWLQLVVVIIIAYLASLLTTLASARRAASIYPADALRYE
ncbi:MAG: ABC transporter permease [Chloroflexi bacterium]|nr:ABC transporter permease [Chloroflexota bacterium]